MTSQVNIQIPPGSVADLQDAASWHAQIADTLEQGQKVLVGNSVNLATRWEGVAAATYAEYSREVEASYSHASSQAREIAGRLRDWARQLEEDQKQSRTLLREAETTQSSLNRWKRTLEQDQAELQQWHSRESVTVSYSSQIAACQQAVGADQAKISQLEAHLTRLQQQATKIYTAAEERAKQTNGYLNSVSVTPPPLLHAAATAPANQVQSTGVPQYAAGAAGAAGAVAAGASSPSAATGAAPSGEPAASLVPADLKPVASGTRMGDITFDDLEEIGRKYGWSPAQDAAWWKVIQLESGGNASARNPSSGAYGIGQFLGSTLTEYAPYGAASSNPLDQLNAMARYIDSRYGTPQAALSFHLAHNWY